MQALSKLVSYLFHPLLGPTYAVAMLLNTIAWRGERLAHFQGIIIIAFVFLFTFIFPVLVISILKLTNQITDFHLNDRNERRLPFTIVALCYSIVYYLVASKMPHGIFTDMFLALASSVVLALLVNSFYKISIHAISSGGLIAMCLVLMPYFYFDGRYFLLVLILLAGLVGMARLWLKAHTPGQVYTGYLAGFLTVYLILQL